MNRLLTVLYVIICLEMGVLLFVFPWVPLWNNNFFIDHFPWLSHVARNYFVRGAISGIGLADIWLAFYEVSHLRSQVGHHG